ncbi:hypothetical protein MUA34_05430 [Staphylococcus delphini]|uniref:hypothetical protein n=1 Tax=Staphylococcus delphini TaxID=53344 RepID=UPI0021D24E3F|nr:hypothetical protein [Staphylococcus delphini]UXS37838.1 hypothetical protein MUA34_05430 [Staphylococcus delphini]
MSELKPLSGDKTLYKLITDNKYDKIRPKGNNSGGDNMSDFIKRDEFENFKTHLDNKFDRLIDKVDENRRELKEDMKHQTMVTISVISAIITVVGVLVPVILHFI